MTPLWPFGTNDTNSLSKHHLLQVSPHYPSLRGLLTSSSNSLAMPSLLSLFYKSFPSVLGAQSRGTNCCCPSFPLPSANNCPFLPSTILCVLASVVMWSSCSNRIDYFGGNPTITIIFQS